MLPTIFETPNCQSAAGSPSQCDTAWKEGFFLQSILTGHPVPHPVIDVCSICVVENICNVDRQQQSHDLFDDVTSFSVSSKSQPRWLEGALIRLHDDIEVGDVFLNM